MSLTVQGPLTARSRSMLDTRSEADWSEVVAGDQGVLACIGMMACADVCPKELLLLDVYAYLRR